MSTDSDYIRVCPSCGAENSAQLMRCGCGALLAGVDLVDKAVLAEAAAKPIAQPIAQPRPTPVDTGSAPGVTVCAFDDCAQPNQPGAVNCVYCNRPLPGTAEQANQSEQFKQQQALTPPEQLSSLFSLPTALKSRFRIIQTLPAQGAEAELLLVEALDGGPTLVAKIYRQGILPKREVQQRLSRIDARHRVGQLEAGISDGYAYELMEYCRGGSWRARLEAGPVDAATRQVFIAELAAAIDGVHAAGLVHRDLKPENILLRSAAPLDLVLTDFATASVLDATQRFTGTARTLPYAAPESLSGVIDGKADYWAFGMMILEAALGRHPFAGLSEAVILHQLTTRNIDLTGILAPDLRKLLRGLFVRDPKARWGGGEVARWLANDITLAEASQAGSAREFSQPYHLGDEICHTVEQLAVALTRNWREGVADCANGQLLVWFRDVQKDQNLVRLLLELRNDSKMPVDVQLLKVILRLAPGIPPVWRGESIELPAILAHANLALKGDAEAVRWLDLLYQYRVLEVYAEANYPQAIALVRQWNQACDRFAQAWSAMLGLIRARRGVEDHTEYANIDDLLYGGHGPAHPPLAQMHPRLLAIAYDPAWLDRLRKRVIAELTGLIVHCPWFAELGAPDGMDAASLLVLEHLLPEAKKIAQRQIEARQRQSQTEAAACLALREELNAIVKAVRGSAETRFATQAVCTELRGQILRYLELLQTLRASGRADGAWLDLKKSATRCEKAMLQIQLLIDRDIERRAITRGWLNRDAAVFALLTAFFASLKFGARAALVLAALALGVLAWRIGPSLGLMRKIGALVRRL